MINVEASVHAKTQRLLISSSKQPTQLSVTLQRKPPFGVDDELA